MQSLWSRAGQAHRCGCRVCETAVSTLGRRATTAAVRPRKPTFAEIFTAAYSSLFASAAVFDAIRKEDRRQDLDRQLDDARRELAEVQQLRALETKRITESLDNDHPELSSDQMDELWASLKAIYTGRPFMKEIHRPVTLRVSEFITRLQETHYHTVDDATIQELRRTDYERLERAIIEEELNSRIVQRTPKTRQQLHNDSRTMVYLVRQLLERAEASDKSTSPSPSFEEACSLASARKSLYTFDSIDPAGAMSNKRKLNQRLREIVNTPQPNLREMVGKICYNLLIAAHPADMHTYNTLIVAFDKFGHKNLAESLVNSFFYYRRLNPTPSTFVAILNHYKTSDNHGKFLRAIACLTGLDAQTGAKVGRRHVRDLEEQQIEREWVQGKGMTRTGDWIWKHAPLNQHLVETILNGLLHFKLFDQAATFFVACMKARVSLNTNIIRQLFDECILALDWKAALRLVRGFTNFHSRFPMMVLRQEDSAPYLIHRLRVLVDICGLNSHIDSKSMLANLGISSVKFRRFMETLSRADVTSKLESGSHSGLADSELDAMTASSKSRLLQIESLWKEHALAQRTTQSIESKLLYPDFSLEFRTSMAQHIAESAQQHSLELSQNFVRLLSQRLEIRGIPETLEACKQFQTSLESTGEDGPTLETELDTVSQRTVGEEESRTPQGDELSALTPREPSTPVTGQRKGAQSRPLKARPMRALAWPVPDQRPAYSAQSQLVELG